MTRTIPRFLFLIGLLLTGCSRSADPLDWKIEGRHLPDLQESLDRIIASLPKDLSHEFIFCFNNIKADTLSDQSGTLKEQEDRVCRRLRDKRVREILIEGYEIAGRASEAQLAYQSDLLVRLLKRDDRATDARGKPMSQRIKETKAVIESLKQKQEKSERRLAELRAQAGGH